MGSGIKPPNTPSVASSVADSGVVVCPDHGVIEGLLAADNQVIGRTGQLSASGETIVLTVDKAIAASAEQSRIAECIENGFDYEGVLEEGSDGLAIRYQRV